MPMTNAWDETQPLGSAAASTLDDIIRTLKADIRERLEPQHVFGDSVSTDGAHKHIDIPATAITANTSYLKGRGGSLTGASAVPAVDVQSTWNTTNAPTLVVAQVEDTASSASSLLLNLIVGAASKFAVDKFGNVTAAGSISGGSGGAFVPSGGMLFWPNPSGVPVGWLVCNGQAVSRTTYSVLFSVLGTGYGVGDGVTTFNLPDLQGKAPYGVAASGTGSTFGSAFGSMDHTHTGPSHTHTGPSHTHTYSQVPNHVHGISDGGHAHGITDVAHAHGITDVAHSHTITDVAHGHLYTDPLHKHTIVDPTHTHAFQVDVGGGGETYISTGGFTTHNSTGTAEIRAAATGITETALAANSFTINASGTGLTGVNASGSGLTGTAASGTGLSATVAALTGISATGNPTGGVGAGTSDAAGTGATGASGTGATGTGNAPGMPGYWIVKT